MAKKRRRIVSIELDPARPAPLSRKHKAELATLASMPDHKIDYSDIPPILASFWERAVRGGLYRPVKRQMTVRIDADVVEWLKAEGKGYHGRLNRILRSAMMNDLKSRASGGTTRR